MAAHRILLTGANGYIASHILFQLLSQPTPHSIRAVVRSQSKVDDVKALFPSASSKQLDFAIVPDMVKPGAFDEALKSDTPFDIVIHTASPCLYVASTGAKHFLEPAIKGTIEVLEGIQRVTVGSVKRVVLTSSFATVGAFGQVDETNKVYTEADWNPLTLDKAEANDDDAGLAYLASKKFAELAAWEVQKREGVRWDLVVLNPPMVYGPILHKVNKMEELNESVARFWNSFLKDRNTDATLAPNEVDLYVDVRDIAHAHLLAMDAPNAGNQRFNTTAGAVTSQEIADILRAEVPGAVDRTPKGEPGKNTQADGAYTIDSNKARDVLGWTLRSAKETFADMGRQLLELEKSL
ncbi:NAD(P)-binding protein [Massarina eburnea CBS 473.64]|uniref:NAD(P)-binding protein n=1 Tax=Massarina eburnea CBS 473.64 TaxID=1395130 RepID=A0A6A6RTE3_9PLEO|nr:NAD(P)-binding protein [Massarina eburnea CBS 473.64]